MLKPPRKVVHVINGTRAMKTNLQRFIVIYVAINIWFDLKLSFMRVLLASEISRRLLFNVCQDIVV